MVHQPRRRQILEAEIDGDALGARGCLGREIAARGASPIRHEIALRRLNHHGVRAARLWLDTPVPAFPPDSSLRW